MPRYRRRPAVFLWSRLLLALAVVFCLWLVWHLTDVLMPFAAAFALAYMAVPVVDRLGRMGVNRTLATNLMLLLAIALVVLVMLLVIPMFVSQIQGLVDRLPGLVDWLERTVSPRIHEFFGITVHFDVNSIKTGLAAHLGSVRSALANLLPALTSQGIALLTFLTNVLLTPLLALIDASERQLGRKTGFNADALARYLRFARDPATPWPGNLRDLHASAHRMTVLAERGRVTVAMVDAEIATLRGQWDAADADGDAALLQSVLPGAILDEFDRAQLAAVIRACRASPSLSAAGRRLFAISREGKTSQNDADRLRKYLARFGLGWSDITDSQAG